MSQSIFIARAPSRPGKLADFVILSANPLAVKPEELITLEVVETTKEGKSVYKAT